MDLESIFGERTDVEFRYFDINFYGTVEEIKCSAIEHWTTESAAGVTTTEYELKEIEPQDHVKELIRWIIDQRFGFTPDASGEFAPNVQKTIEEFLIEPRVKISIVLTEEGFDAGDVNVFDRKDSPGGANALEDFVGQMLENGGPLSIVSLGAKTG